VKSNIYDEFKKMLCECLNKKANEYMMEIVKPCTCAENPFSQFIECKITMKAQYRGIAVGIVNWYEICDEYAIEYILVKQPNSMFIDLYARIYTWEIR